MSFRRLLAPVALMVALLTPPVASAAATATPAAAKGYYSAPVKKVKAGQGTVFYRSVGSGPPLVLIMGLSSTMDTWPAPFLDRLVAQGRRVIVFDNAGAARSTAAPAGKLSIPGMGDDTASLIRALKLGRADVLGWSMGSMIAQALAVEHPRQVRRLVLAASAPGDGKATPPDPVVNTQPGGFAAALFPPGMDALFNAYIAGITKVPNAVPLAPTPVVDAQKAAIGRWFAGTEPAGKRIGKLKLPVLIGAGGVDKLLPIANDRHLAKVIPRAKLKVYPDAAHGFFIQHPSFAGVVDRFLG